MLPHRFHNTMTWTMHSDDEGQTWSKPVPVPLGNYSKSRPSPGRGLELAPSFNPFPTTENNALAADPSVVRAASVGLARDKSRVRGRSWVD